MMNFRNTCLCLSAGFVLVACGGNGGGAVTEASLVRICTEHQTHQASQGTDAYSETFLNGRDPQTLSKDVIRTCCPVYAKSAMAFPDADLRQLAYNRFETATDISLEERSQLMQTRRELESKFDKETLSQFWSRGAMQDFNACRKENFFPNMPG